MTLLLRPTEQLCHAAWLWITMECFSNLNVTEILVYSNKQTKRHHYLLLVLQCFLLHGASLYLQAAL